LVDTAPAVSAPNPYSVPSGSAPNPYTLPGGIPVTPLPPAVFYATVTIYRSAPGAEQRGDPLLNTGALVYDGPASVYPDRLPSYSESHLRPEGAQRWHVITPTDPGATTGDVVHWTDRVFSVLARSADHSGGLAREWWTGCAEVS
jgi:hypothetical protein